MLCAFARYFETTTPALTPLPPDLPLYTEIVMLRYAITNRAMYPGDEEERRALLVLEASRWAVEGVDFIQLREKDLEAAALTTLAREILQAMTRSQSQTSQSRTSQSQTRLLINSRPDIALATGAHGVHLSAHPEELTCEQVRALYASRALPAPVITLSCHSLEEVQRARRHGVSAILFAPVFEKAVNGEVVVPGQGLGQLRAACAAASPVPVFALGGVDATNAALCLDAGAAGIAGIRLFHKS
jgi:thiamine-phosphate pyrophosphorylase